MFKSSKNIEHSAYYIKGLYIICFLSLYLRDPVIGARLCGQCLPFVQCYCKLLLFCIVFLFELFVNVLANLVINSPWPRLENLIENKQDARLALTLATWACAFM